MATNKKKKWVRYRHQAMRNLVYLPLKWTTRRKYHARIDKFKEQRKKPYLILFNHQTAFDQFFVSLACRKHVYYIASEDLFSNGWVSKLLRWAFAPIPIKKQATDPRAVLTCLRVKKEGGSIALSPEGNRTFSGRTGYMKDAIVSFIRALKMPIAFFRIEGGFGVQPRWSDCTRKGKMHCYVSKTMELEEYQSLTDEELFAVIEKELYVDEACLDGEFKHKELAQYLERAAYYCSDCGLSNFESEKDIVTCKKCGKQVRYMPDKTLQGVNCEFPFRFYADWYDAQSEYVNGLDVLNLNETPLFSDEARLSEVVLYENKKLIAENAKISLFGDRVEIEADGEILKMPFAEGSVASVLGRNKLNLYFGGKVYQLKGESRFNALKYVQICYRCKNQLKGDENGKFLGL